MKRDPRNCRGVTVLEIMIVVVMVSILSVIAIPSFQQLLSNNRTSTQVNEFVTDLNLARSEAIKRGERVTVCKSDDQETCTNGTWADGWIVFVESDTANAAVDAGEEILRVRTGLPSGATMTGDSGVEDFVSFVPTGFTRLMNGRIQSGDITLTGTDQTVTININSAGRVRTEKS
ncbi:MAG: GspH/FimT family pseudopilin [Desulfovibrionales bacterium]